MLLCFGEEHKTTSPKDELSGHKMHHARKKDTLNILDKA